jgi:glycosyltransferase involved in cell wall biosynthesis
MSALRVAVVIPALNEERSIGQVVARLPKDCVHEIIVVDNGSTDRTDEVARAAGATVLHETRRGYGYACLAGIRHALTNSPDAIAFVDGDLSDYPEELPLLLHALEEGNDLVIGSRMLGEREPGALLPQALIGNKVACFFIQRFWGARFTDLGPFRVIRVDALRRLMMNDGTYGWTVEMQIKAAKVGLRCTEVPVRYRKRIGTSKVTGTLAGSLNASVKILYTIFKYLFVKV